MKLSVIIVNYNVKYFLEQCILSVLESKVDFGMEIFVVDNNSTDGSQSYIQSKYPEIIYIDNKENTGFASANNQAIAQSNGEYVLLLNPDTVLGEHVLQNTCDFMDKHPESGGVGVKMINGFGTFLPESKRGFPSPWTSFCKIFGLASIFPKSKLFGKYHLKYLDENQIHEVDVLAGAFMLLRKDVLDKIGYLDETFFMYGEDIDLSYRIVKAGYKNFYLPEKIIHYKGESTKKNDMKYVKIFYEAMYIFFKKHYPSYGLIYSFFIYAGIYFRASLAIVRRILKIGTNKESNTNKKQLLNHADLSYASIINQMDAQPASDTQYLIYSPKSGMVIGSHYAETYRNYMNDNSINH